MGPKVLGRGVYSGIGTCVVDEIDSKFFDEVGKGVELEIKDKVVFIKLSRIKSMLRAWRFILSVLVNLVVVLSSL